MTTRNPGFVLVSVLWVVALLTVITISYHHRARLEVRAARYSLDTSQARITVRAIVARALLELRNKTLVDGLALNPAQQANPNNTHLGQRWAQTQNLLEEGGLLSPEAGFENDVAQYSIEDLERYININAVDEALLAKLPGMSLPVLRRINFHRAGEGNPGNASTLFQDPTELRYVRGVDDDAWYGNEEAPGLRELLTTYGDGRININTAPLPVLRSLFGAEAALAEAFIGLRNGPDGLPNTPDDRGFSDWDQLSRDTNITGELLTRIRQLCKFNSNFFRIKAIATRRGGLIQSHAAVIVAVPQGSDIASILSWSEDTLGSQ